jgi:prepilin-type N-terminal cleavage/methylation domain-containing protein
MNLAVRGKTRMSTAGKTNRNNIKPFTCGRKEGFTLLELTVVIFLAGMLLSITVPVVREALLHDNLKTASRTLVATITRVRDKSVTEYQDHTLFFDIEKGLYWYEKEGMDDAELLTAKDQAKTLPEDVRILDIDQHGSERKADGEQSIRFSRKGYMRYSLIHLGDKGERKFTLVLEPFLGKVKIMEDYLSFEDIESKDI